MSAKRYKIRLSSGFALYIYTAYGRWMADLAFNHQCTIRTWHLSNVIISSFEQARAEAIACYNRWLDDIHLDVSKRNCTKCGEFCSDPVEGELHRMYCSVDCLRQNGDTEGIA